MSKDFFSNKLSIYQIAENPFNLVSLQTDTSKTKMITENCKIPDSCGIIMAGGKSSRMGTDKALLEINGKSLFRIAYENLRTFTEKQVLSINRDDVVISGVKSVADTHKNIGPASGIYSCLMVSGNEFNVFQSVDAPFVTPELYCYLFENIENYDCIIPVNVNRKEPLLGIYRKRCASVLLHNIEQKQYKLAEILKGLNVRYVEINDSQGFYSEQIFFNINKPEDFRKAINL